MPDTFVLDCSIAAKWFFQEPDRDPAVRLRKRYESGEIFLIAPDLLLTEFASLLAKRARRKQISVRDAREAFEVMTNFAPRLIDSRTCIAHALDIALQHQLSLWDSIYLAIALEHSCPFLTADRRLFRTGRGAHPSIQLIQ